MENMERLPAVDRAYQQIKLDILAGAHGLGGRLKEEELAERVGVSRTPVREALRRLSSEGLVDFRPNQGAFVATWSARDIEEIFSLRSVLESHGARLAATRIDAAAVAELAQLQDAMEATAQAREADYLQRISELNDRFHQIILRAADNQRLVRLLSGIVEMPLVLRTYGIYTQAQLERSFRHHRELVAALGARDPDWAGAVMECHIRAARSAYMAGPASPAP